MIKDLLAHIALNSSQVPTEGATSNDSKSNSGMFGAILSSISNEENEGEHGKESLNLDSDSTNFEQDQDQTILEHTLETNESEQGDFIEVASPEESAIIQKEVELDLFSAEGNTGQELQTGVKKQVPTNTSDSETADAVLLQQAFSADSESSEQSTITISKQADSATSDVKKGEMTEKIDKAEYSNQKSQEISVSESKSVDKSSGINKQIFDTSQLSQKEVSTKLEQKALPLSGNREDIERPEATNDSRIIESNVPENSEKGTSEVKKSPLGLETRDIPFVQSSQPLEPLGHQNYELEDTRHRNATLTKSEKIVVEQVSNKVSELSKTNSIGTVNSQNVQSQIDKPISNNAESVSPAYEAKDIEFPRAESPLKEVSPPRLEGVTSRLVTTKPEYPVQEKIFETKVVPASVSTDPVVPTNNTTLGIEFGGMKNPELIQVIQTHKAGIVKPKEINNQQFALSTSEQAETRLKLLFDSVRPEIFPAREVPVGFISSHSMDEGFQFYSPELTLSVDQELMLKEFMTESIQGKEPKSSEQNLLGFMRLGELPVLNSIARRTLVSSFAKVLQQEVSTPVNQQQEQWQKHSFKLDDGNNIDMTTRNIDGVLHIKLAASNPELNRLLQNMEQEIKDHLKEELNLELDLQFENREDAFTNLMGDSSGESRSGMKNSNSDHTSEENDRDQNIGLQPSIRNFGYNQMEWTA